MKKRFAYPSAIDFVCRSSIITTVFFIFYTSVISANAKKTGAYAQQFFVSPTGSPAGNGSESNPWDLQTALNHPAVVVPGSTICLAAGRYTGNYTSALTGTVTDPIIVKPCTGARVIIDESRAGFIVKNIPTLLINGAHTWYMGFEVTNSDPERAITQSGSNPPERRGAGLSLFGAGIKIINLIIYDTGEGIDAWSPVVNGEFYGNIIFNNGWYAPDNHHGHGIYTQNNTGTKKFIDNIILQNFGFGWQIFGSINSFLNNFYLEGNLVFNDRWLIGGSAPLHNIEMNNNFTYQDTMQIGYASNVLNTGLTLRNNFFANLLKIYYWNDANVKSNTLFMKSTLQNPVLMNFEGPPNLVNFQFDSNTYYWSTPGPAYQDEVGIGWENNLLPAGDPNQKGTYLYSHWNQMGQDIHSNVQHFPLQGTSNYQLTGKKVFLRKNLYDQKRANIVIYNWDLSAHVLVDVSGVLSAGDSYELRNVQNYFGDVITGIHTGGPLSVPMTNHTVAFPFGYNLLLGDNTFPEFGSFVLINTSGNTVLPVKFTDFSLLPQNRKALLKWSITDDQEVSRYIVERSADGQNFISFASVSPSGLNTSKTYQLVDDHPLNGKSFYRIKAIDIRNGSYFSSTELFHLEGTLSRYSISPNPANKILQIRKAPGLPADKLTVTIHDAGGRLRISQQVIPHNSVYPVDISLLAKGTYFLTMELVNSVERLVFIKE